MAETRDFHCYSHVFENLEKQTIPSDHAVVRLVILKPTTRGQSWMSKHPVFCSLLHRPSRSRAAIRAKASDSRRCGKLNPSWCRAGSSEQICGVLALTARSTAQSYRAPLMSSRCQTPYKAKMSSLEGAAGVLISSRSDPFETSSTSVAMRGASSSTIKSDVSLAALMRALILRADLPRAVLDKLATTRATAGFSRLPVFVDFLTSLARDTALTREPRK